MKCEQCGLPLIGTEGFCPQCGTPIKEKTAPKAAPEAPAPPSEPAATEATEPVAAAKPSASISNEPAVIETTDVPLVATNDELEHAVPIEPETPATPEVETPITRQPAAPAMREPLFPPPPTRASRPAAVSPRARKDAPVRRQRLPAPLLLGMLAGLLFFVIIGLAALGIFEGNRMRQGRDTAQAVQHYNAGLAYMQKGQYDLAAAEFEQALRLRKTYPEAQQKLIEARSKAPRAPTPTQPAAATQPSSLLAEGRAAYDRGAWDTATEAFEALRTADPNYEQAMVSRLLVNAYSNSGLKLVNEDRLEEAIRRFDQALAIQPDNPDVLNQRRLATLYQSALSAWGMDWRAAITDFAAVYALKPDYKDTAQRLQNAYIQSGDAAAGQSAWCDALQSYKAALALVPNSDLAAKRDDAARRCAAPTAVPGTPVPAGTFVGAFSGYEDIHQRTTDWAKVQGRVVDAHGQGVGGLKVKISAYDWSALGDTDGNGNYAFEFLKNEVTFTVTLVGVPVQSVDVQAKFGFAANANFAAK